MPEHIFNTRDPIVLGVNIEAGNLRLGTPLVVPSQNVSQLSINLFSELDAGKTFHFIYYPDKVISVL